MKTRIVLIALFILTVTTVAIGIFQDRLRGRVDIASVATAVNTGTAEQFCVPNGTYKFASTDLLTLTTNKKKYNSGEMVIATLILKNNKTTGGQTSYAFNCTAEVQLYADQLYDTRGMMVTRNIHSVKLAKGASRTYTFRFPANKSGAFTLTAYVQGYNEKVTANIGIDVEPTPPGVPGYIVGITPTGNNDVTFATSVTPILRPPTTPIVGPVLPPGGLPPGTTTPTSTPPGVILPPVSGDAPGAVTYEGSDLASYSQLVQIFNAYVPLAATNDDKVKLQALSAAITQVIGETTSADWQNENYSPNTLLVQMVPVSANTVVAAKKNFLASVFASIKSIFIAQAPSPTPQTTYKVGGAAIANVSKNKCLRYFWGPNAINNSGPVPVYTMSVYTDELAKSIRSSNKNWVQNVNEFKLGGCVPISTYESLKEFDVAAAGSEVQFFAEHAARPYDNSRYYDSGRGNEFINIQTLNNLVIRSKLERTPDPTSPGRELIANAEGAALSNMHTAFNDFGPADFSCSYLNLYSEAAVQSLVDSKKTCKSDISLSYAMQEQRVNGKTIGHVEHVKSVEYSSSSKMLTVSTDDGTVQNEPIKLTQLAAKRGVNTYSYRMNRDREVPTLLSVISPAMDSNPGFRERFVGSVQNPKRLKEIAAIICTDKSDVIRTAVDTADFEASYNHERAFWLYMANRSTQFWRNAPKESQPNFSSCAAKVDDLEGAKNILKNKLKSWQKKWNNAAYENRGYVKEDKKDELQEEYRKIYQEAYDLIPNTPCLKKEYRDIDYNAADLVEYKKYTDPNWAKEIPKPKCELLK